MKAENLITAFVLNILCIAIGYLCAQPVKLPPPDISAYYCDPASAYKREEVIIACLNNKNVSPNECEEIGRKVYGGAGFKRGGKIFPCFRALSPNEKLACGEIK